MKELIHIWTVNILSVFIVCTVISMVTLNFVEMDRTTFTTDDGIECTIRDFTITRKINCDWDYSNKLNGVKS